MPNDTKQKHTPGKWYPRCWGKLVEIVDENGDAIVHWSGFDSATAKGATSQEKLRQQANAQLMAAGPVLLKALGEVVSAFQSCNPADHSSDEDIALARARDAIRIAID